MIWLLENWVAIISTISIPIAWIFGGKQAKKLEIKKGEVEIQKEQIDLAKNTREFLLLKESDFKTEREEYRKELATIKDEVKAEREYYREKVNGLRKSIDGLQDKFDKISLNYALEVEKSDSWMKKYFEIEKENQELKNQISKVEIRCKSLEDHIKKIEKELSEQKKLNK
jgi:chromosome segregation ATPase